MFVFRFLRDQHLLRAVGDKIDLQSAENENVSTHVVTCDNGNNHSFCQLSARTALRAKELFHTALLL